MPMNNFSSSESGYRDFFFVCFLAKFKHCNIGNPNFNYQVSPEVFLPHLSENPLIYYQNLFVSISPLSPMFLMVNLVQSLYTERASRVPERGYFQCCGIV